MKLILTQTGSVFSSAFGQATENSETVDVCSERPQGLDLPKGQSRSVCLVSQRTGESRPYGCQDSKYLH